MKCAKCGHAWAQSAPARVAASAPAPILGDIAEVFEETARDVPVARSEEVRPRDGEALQSGKPRASQELLGEDMTGRRANLPAIRKSPSRWNARLAWLLLILVVGGTFGSGLYFRDVIISTLPATKQIYEIFGATPKAITKRLNVGSVQYTYPAPGILRVDGELQNFSSAQHDVPHMQVVFRNAMGETLYVWKFSPPENLIPPNEGIKFSTDIHNYPPEARRITVSLREK